MNWQLEILQQRAENGEAEAQWELTQYYCEHPDEGRPYDWIDWARKAAEQGHPEAEVCWEQAFDLLTRSADGGYAPAQYTLGMLYESTGSSKEAQSYLKAVAKQKYPLAVKHLKAATDQKYAVVHTGLINSGDYETALAHLKRKIKRDEPGVYSYLYGDFWEHNYGGLLPWDDNRPDIASRINMAAGWYAYIYADMSPL